MGWNLNDLTAATSAPAAVGDPAGYMFNAQNTQHVVYRGADNHVHELWNDSNGWHHNDLTNATNAPVTASDPVGYMFDKNVQHVVYRGNDNRIHELWWNGSWHHNDLSMAGDAPPAVGRPAGYAFFGQNTQHVVYRGTDNHIHELWWDGRWHHNDLTKAAYPTLPSYSGVPLAASDPSGYMYDAQGTQHVVYRGTDNLIHELRWDAKGWHINFLTDAVDAPPAVGNPVGYVFAAQNTQHVIYRGGDNHIHELWWNSDGWHYSNLSAATDAPQAASNPTAYMFDSQNTQHVVYQGIDSHVHELWNDPRGWHHNDLTAATNARPLVGNPIGYMYPAQYTQHVMYRGTDGHIHELWWDAGIVNTGYLALEMQYQQQTNWCWAATTVSITKMYNPGASWTQATLVNKAFNVTTACLDPSSKECNNGWYPDQALTITGHLASVDYKGQPLSKVIPEIKGSRPISIGVYWKGGGGHSIVIDGYGNSNPSAPVVHIEDPWYGPSWQDFNTFPASYNGGATWDLTCFTK